MPPTDPGPDGPGPRSGPAPLPVAGAPHRPPPVTRAGTPGTAGGPHGPVEACGGPAGPADATAPAGPVAGAAGAEDDTLDLALTLDLPDLLLLRPEPAPQGAEPSAGREADVSRAAPCPVPGAGVPAAGRASGGGTGGEGPEASFGALLDGPALWGPATTARGRLRLLPVVPERDLTVLTRWMNDPAVAAFWELAGPPQTTERHLRAQLDGDGRSAPCLGVLDGRAMSYWEVYRADLDPLARHYPARPHDTGIHVLIGPVAERARGLGAVLLRAVADLVLAHRPACARVVAEPDLRNTASVSAFLTAGFRFAAELDLPEKRAALMVRDRSTRPFM